MPERPLQDDLAACDSNPCPERTIRSRDGPDIEAMLPKPVGKSFSVAAPFDPGNASWLNPMVSLGMAGMRLGRGFPLDEEREWLLREGGVQSNQPPGELAPVGLFAGHGERHEVEPTGQIVKGGRP